MAHPLSGGPPRRLITTSEGTHRGAFAPIDWILLSGVALVWGSSFMFIEVALERLTPGMITWSRIALGFAVLSTYPSARRPIGRVVWPRLVLLSFTWTSIPFLLFPIAQQHIDSALAGMLNALTTIFAAAIAAVLLRRRPGGAQVAGLLAGVLGAVLISWPALDVGGSNLLGVGLVVVATAFYGFSFNIAAPLQQEFGGPAVMWRSLGLAVLVTFPFAIGGLGQARIDLALVLALGVLGALGTGVVYVWMARLVGRVGATRGGIAIFFLPIVSIVLGVVFLDERVAPIQLVGTAAILAGAAVGSRREAR